MNFTYQNHLKYFIGNRLYGTRESIIEPYIVKVGLIDKDYYKKSNWVNEQERTARLVIEDFGKEFAIFFSGGTDSEIIVRTFCSLGIKPLIFFIKFKDDYNLSDLSIAEKIALELDIKLIVKEVDIIDFYESGAAWDLAEKIQCRQIAYLNILNEIKKLSIPSVMGGEMLLKRHVDKEGSKWYYCFRENEDAGAMRFSLQYKIPLVNEWFSYTPEMMAYYLEHPKIQWLINDRFNYKLSSVTSKNEILTSYMPKLFKKVKTHGFEKLMGFNGESYQKLYQSHTRRLEPSLDGIFIEDLKQQLGLT